ncbi:MAG: glycerol-3-phosphate acyltransferase [Chloroflexi bacterium]|nr:glycerol-3-phosphate acyltransferase [Chloroflexota bacterium]
MIVNEPVTGSIAIINGYLLGAIPMAYIVTCLLTGKDIRQIGGGNVGARNVFVEVNKAAGIFVAIFDIGKGAAAVAIAQWGLDLPPAFVWLAGIAAVVGHIWSVYLKFAGGNGLATSLGVFAVTMGWELLIAFGIMAILFFINRRLILSLNTSLSTVPLSGWLLGSPWQSVVFSLALLLIMLAHYYPRVKQAAVEAESKKAFVGELFRRKNAKRG